MLPTEELAADEGLCLSDPVLSVFGVLGSRFDRVPLGGLDLGLGEGFSMVWVFVRDLKY